jgi:hypothetical protein
MNRPRSGSAVRFKTSPVARLARLCPLAVLAVAGTAHGADFTFTSTLGNGLWFSEAQVGPTWFNNWGQSGGAPGLMLPGAADTANLAGSVTGNGNLTVAAINNPATGTFTHTGSAMTTVLTNNGAFGFTPGSRTYSGTWINNPSGTITLGAGGGWTVTGTGLSINNAGTLLLPADLNANDIAWTNFGTINKVAGGTQTIAGGQFTHNGGMVMSTGGSLILTGTALNSMPGATWATTASNTIRLVNNAISGVFAGNHSGAARLAGATTLAGNTTFTSTGAGTQPWIRETGSISTTSLGAFTFTNAGAMLLEAGSIIATGGFFNTGSLTANGNGWTYTLSSASTFTNSGSISFPGSVNIVGGGPSTVVTNTGSVTKSDGGTTGISSLAFSHNAGSITQTSGTFSISSANVTSSPVASWSAITGGAISISGSTLAGTFNSAGSYSTLNSPTLVASTTLNSSASGGWNINGTLTGGGFVLSNLGQAFFSILGGTNDLTNVTVNNALAATLTLSNGAGWTITGSNATINNAGTVVIPGSVNINQGANSFTFSNSGVLQRSASGGTATFNDVAFNHTGSLVHAATGAGNTTFNGGSFSAGPMSSFTIPSGTLTISGANVQGTFNANLSGGAGRVVNATLTASTTLNASGATPWVLETSVNAGGFTLTNAGQLGLSSGGGPLTMTGSITNNASVTWSNGAGWTHTLDGATLNNTGTVTIPASVNVNEGANTSTINNSGTFTRTDGGTTTFSNINVNFNAAGQFNHAPNSGNTDFSSATFAASPTHTFNVQAGRLRFTGGSTLSGTFRGNATGGGVLEVNNSSSTPGTVFDTPGTQPWDFTGTFIPGLGATSIGRSSFAGTGGNFTLQGTFTNGTTGQATFSNGSGWTLAFTGSTYVNQGTTSIPASVNVAGGNINNTGTIARSAGGTANLNGVALNNSGLYNQPIGNSGFNNSPITQTGAGTLRVLSSGRFTFNDASRNISGGRLEGTGTLNSNGTMNPSNLTIAPGDGNPAVGTLTMDGGNLTLDAGDVLEISIDRLGGNPPQVADQLRTTSFSTTVNLSGATLAVRRPSLAYVPSFNVEHVIVDVQGGGTLTGTFASVADANPLDGYGYRVRYTSTQAIMKVVRQCNLSDVASPGGVQLFDGEATADDIIVFIGWFVANDQRADFARPGPVPGGDGELTADDIIYFISLFTQGCGF